MKIDYTAADAANLVRAFGVLNGRNTREGRAIRCAFVDALRACGVQCSHIERGKVHALRVFAPDGQDFPTTKKGVEDKEKSATQKSCAHKLPHGFCTVFDKPCDRRFCNKFCDEYEAKKDFIKKG